jgi:hypothetical protein
VRINISFDSIDMECRMSFRVMNIERIISSISIDQPLSPCTVQSNRFQSQFLTSFRNMCQLTLIQYRHHVPYRNFRVIFAMFVHMIRLLRLCRNYRILRRQLRQHMIFNEVHRCWVVWIEDNKWKRLWEVSVDYFEWSFIC